MPKDLLSSIVRSANVKNGSASGLDANYTKSYDNTTPYKQCESRNNELHNIIAR
jgi:hypothetical protein